MVEPSGDFLVLQVLSGPGEDAEELNDLTAMLREELLELDVSAVEPIMQKAPEGTKGMSPPLVAGWLSTSVLRASSQL
jgi:hypothetical protein